MHYGENTNVGLDPGHQQYDHSIAFRDAINLSRSVSVTHQKRRQYCRRTEGQLQVDCPYSVSQRTPSVFYELEVSQRTDTPYTTKHCPC
ncbi:hypothetical protein BaRGS_00006896 [Batillaria attramentaria]|uniref:Uncharacterized protein n=1 Tax=Batillaria attramentaria TaxID=370345 RepID=A0ABD0LRC6_9CAEN